MLIKRATEPLDAGGPEVVGSTSGESAELLPKLEITHAGDAVRLHPPAVLHANGADLRWDKWDGSSGAAFDRYEVHRSTSASFTPSATTLRDPSLTAYRDTTAAAGRSFTYKVTANGSASSPQTVTLPATGKATMTLQPTASESEDTYLDGWALDGTDCYNSGADTWMNVGADYDVYRSLVEFDVRAVPAGSRITDAKLSLYDEYPTYEPMTVAVHRATSAGEEGTLVNEHGATHYGGVTGWRVDGALELELTPKAAEALAAHGGYRIHLTNPGDDEVVMRRLEAILH